MRSSCWEGWCFPIVEQCPGWKSAQIYLSFSILNLYRWKKDLILRHTGPAWSIWRCREMQAWFPSGVMLLHFCDEQEGYLQHRRSTIAFRPLVVVMTCARCKRCLGLRMASFRKFQQISCITHKVCIAVEICTHQPLHTRVADDDLHDLTT